MAENKTGGSSATCQGLVLCCSCGGTWACGMRRLSTGRGKERGEVEKWKEGRCRWQEERSLQAFSLRIEHLLLSSTEEGLQEGESKLGRREGRKVGRKVEDGKGKRRKVGPELPDGGWSPVVLAAGRGR